MTTAKLRAAWQLFKDAMAGDTELNYTQGSIPRVTVLLAIPMILEMSMEAVFAVVDIFFVAGLGTDAVATVGLTEAVITLLYAVAIGLAMGTTALVARRIGENDRNTASLTAGQALWVGFAVSVVVGLIGLFFAREILLIMGASESVIATGLTYTRLMFGASFSIVFLFLVNAIFRGAGDANLAMRALVLANGINIVLDPCLIYGLGPFPELGVTGAAVATNIGRSIGIGYGLYYLCGGGGRIRLHLKDMALKLGLAWAIVRVSLGGMAQFLVATASWVFLMQIVAGFGSAAVAGYTISVRIILFLILPVWGLCNASATLVGQNLGAGLPDRAETTVWYIARYATWYMAATAALLLLFARPVALWFTSEPEAVEYAVASLRILSLGFIFLGFGTAIIQAFNGAGDTMTPTWINVLCFWVVQVPLAYALALALGLGPEGVFWAVFVSDMLTGIVGILVFRRGSWKLRAV